MRTALESSNVRTFEAEHELNVLLETVAEALEWSAPPVVLAFAAVKLHPATLSAFDAAAAPPDDCGADTDLNEEELMDRSPPDHRAPPLSWSATTLRNVDKATATGPVADAAAPPLVAAEVKLNEQLVRESEAELATAPPCVLQGMK